MDLDSDTTHTETWVDEAFASLDSLTAEQDNPNEFDPIDVCLDGLEEFVSESARRIASNDISYINMGDVATALLALRAYDDDTESSSEPGE